VATLRSQGVQQRKRLFGRASKLRFATFSMQPCGDNGFAGNLRCQASG